MERCKGILVVEDDHDIREVMEDVLTSEGFSVWSAKNGKEALKVLRAAHGPMLIFLDLMMPIMSGWEFLDAMKNDPTLSVHKVVTISAVDASQSIEDPTPLETAGKIRKPISLESVWVEINKYCELPTATAV